MKLTKRQKEEVNFLTKHFCHRQPTDEEIAEYVDVTVHGVGKHDDDKFSTNILRNAKQRLNVNIEMWREDLTKGLISKNELIEDFNCPYGNRLVESIINSVTKTYRFNLLSRSKEMTLLAITNFDILPIK